MLKIEETNESEITRISCPCCGEKIPRIGLLKKSKILGLTFKCRRCGKLFEIKTE